MWHLIREDVLAAVLDLLLLLLTSHKSKGFAKTVAMNAIIKEKGLKKSQIKNKCNKEMKSATSERQQFPVGWFLKDSKRVSS